MEKKFEKGSEEWQFCSDFWRFRQQYYEAESEEWFEILVRRSDELYEKYKGTEIHDYVKELLLAHNRDVEKRWYSGLPESGGRGKLLEHRKDVDKRWGKK